jgi:hypothetical protein
LPNNIGVKTVPLVGNFLHQANLPSIHSPPGVNLTDPHALNRSWIDHGDNLTE